MGRLASTALQLIRFAGLLLIALGILFWTGHAKTLVPIHMLIGLIFVVSLWTLSGSAARTGVGSGLVTLAVVTGLVVLVLGLTQRQLLPGSAHVVIRVLHLLVGLAAMGLAEAMGARIKRARAPAPRPAA